MKKLIVTAATVLFVGLISFAYENGTHAKIYNNRCVKATENAAMYKPDQPEELKYEIRARKSSPVKKELLQGAKLVNDIIPDYPVNWITAYISVEISATCNGKPMIAVSPDNILTEEQKNLLNAIDIGTDLVININYTYKTPVTKTTEKNNMHISMTLVPDVEAEYIGGREEMFSYLKKHINKFSKITPEQLQRVTIRFTVNEEGKVTNAMISNPTGYDEVYITLLDAITSMPKWKPAENKDGLTVKQEFEFSVGRAGC